MLRFQIAARITAVLFAFALLLGQSHPLLAQEKKADAMENAIESIKSSGREFRGSIDGFRCTSLQLNYI